MESRTIYTKLWRDEWFGNLSRASRLLFIYCLTNSANNQTGIYDTSDRVICFETGLTNPELEECKKELHPKIVFYKGWIKILNASRYNNFKGESNVKAQEKELNRVPSEISEYFNNLDRVCTPSLDPVGSLNLILSNQIKSNPEIKDVISYFNNVHKKAFPLTDSPVWKKNYEYWRNTYSVEQIKSAILIWKKQGGLWKDKDGKFVNPELEVLFRQKDRNQNQVDRIASLLSNSKRSYL